MDKIGLDTVMADLVDVLVEMDGAQVAEIYNRICTAKIRYETDGVWVRKEEHEEHEP